MKSTAIKIVTAIFALSLISSVGLAAQKGSMEGHGKMDHGSMKKADSSHTDMDHSKMGHTMEGDKGEVMGVGVIHSISKLNKMVNLTHEPIPALKWSEMTMDLPVSDSVDLGSLKAGDKVTFHLKLGDDNRYIITKIMK